MTARLAPLELESLDPDTRAVIEVAASAMGFLPNDGLTMAHVPGLPQAFAGLTRVIYAPGTLSMELKRLIALMHSQAAGCTYCQGHTRHGALLQGITEDKLSALWDYEHESVFNEAERAALRLAHHAALVPNAVEDADFEALKAFYEPGEIAEIVAVIALFGFLNRWNDTLKTELETEQGVHSP